MSATLLRAVPDWGLRGAADVMIHHSRKTDELIRLTNDKQKDAEQFEPITMKLKVVDLGVDERTGKPMTSCVPVGAKDNSAPGGGARLNESEQTALSALASLDTTQQRGVTTAEWKKATASLSQKTVHKSSYQRWRGNLAKLGYVQSDDSKPPRYRTTQKGRANANGTPPAHQ